MQRTRQSRVGSTLIELLVITGLIAVMIALLIPVVLNHGDNTVVQKFAQKIVRSNPFRIVDPC